jgi:hypothetical protein
LTAQPASQTINSSSTGSYLLTATPSNGFAGAVTLTVGGLPKSGMTSTWTVNGTTSSGSSMTLPASAATRNVALAIGGAQPPAGTYSIPVTATSGSLSHQVSLTLVILNQNAANFTLSVNPSSQTVAQGTIGSTVSITRSSWTGNVALAVSGLPANASATFTPAATTGSSATLSISSSSSTPAGIYTIVITGTGSLTGDGNAGNGNGNGAGGQGGSGSSSPATRYAAFSLTVLPPFSISGDMTTALALGTRSTQALDLSITNPYSTPLTVSNLAVTLTKVQQAAGAKGTCNQTGVNSPNFQVTNLPASYSVTIPASSKMALSQLGSGARPTVTWIDQPGWAQNGCLGATLSFGYAGNGSF